MVAAVTPDDVADIMQALVAQAKAGDIAAARLVLERVFGRVSDTETLERIEALETATSWAKFPQADIGSGSSVSVPGRGRINMLYALDMDQLKTVVFDDQAKRLLVELDADKNNYQALNSLGVLNAKFGKLEDALSYFSKAAIAQPMRAPAFANLGNVYMLQKKFREASTMYEKAVNLSPDNSRLRISLARAYFETGKAYKAKSEYQAAVRNNAGYARRYAYLSLIHI